MLVCKQGYYSQRNENNVSISIVWYLIVNVLKKANTPTTEIVKFSGQEIDYMGKWMWRVGKRYINGTNSSPSKVGGDSAPMKDASRYEDTIE